MVEKQIVKKPMPESVEKPTPEFKVGEMTSWESPRLITTNVRLLQDSKVKEKFAEEALYALDYILRIGEDDRKNFPLTQRKVDDAPFDEISSFGTDGKIDMGEWMASRLDYGNKDNALRLTITSHDLWIYDSKTGLPDWVYGGAHHYDYRQEVIVSSYQMTARYAEEKLLDVRTNAVVDAPPVVLRILTLHELAHFFDAPNKKRKDVEYILGLHCKRTDCALGQIDVEGRPTALEATKNIMDRMKKEGGGYFCPHCEKDIAEGKRKCLERRYKNNPEKEG